jgi:hypothetical protein
LIEASQSLEIQTWPIDRLVFYARNPRKNDSAVDRMCSSIREFGFKIPVLARSNGEVIDGHLRLKAARKLGSLPGGGMTAIPADWDEELLALELQDLNAADFDLILTGFDPKEIDDLLLAGDEDDEANATPPLPDNPVSRPGDLWLCGNPRTQHRILCGDSTNAETVARLLGDRKPLLMVTDPPYGIELDTEWRDRAGLNGCGPAEASYMKQRTAGHTETTISGDTRADSVSRVRTGAKRSDCLRMARVHLHARGARRTPAHRLPVSAANHLEQGTDGAYANALLVSA